MRVKLTRDLFEHYAWAKARTCPLGGHWGHEQIRGLGDEAEPAEKVALVDKLLTSLDKQDKDIDELWAKEAESRIDAY
jgi:hypothetical protein